MAFHRDSGSGGKRGGQRFGGSGKSFGGGKRFGEGSRGFQDKPAMKFPATCAECGSRCQVPFKPNGSKPVLCSTCFGNDGGSTKNTFSAGKNFGAPRPSSAMDDLLAEINNKLDHIIRSLKD